MFFVASLGAVGGGLFNAIAGGIQRVGYFSSDFGMRFDTIAQ